MTKLQSSSQSYNAHVTVPITQHILTRYVTASTQVPYSGSPSLVQRVVTIKVYKV
jgi:hypothetical protein